LSVLLGFSLIILRRNAFAGGTPLTHMVVWLAVSHSTVKRIPLRAGTPLLDFLRHLKLRRR